MGLLDKIVSFGLKTLSKNKSMTKIVSKSTQKGTQAFRIKPSITMPVRPTTIEKGTPFTIDKAALETIDNAKGELGNTALRLADEYKSKEKAARKLLHDIFPNSDISVRSKGGNSVYSKLEKKVKKGKVITSDNDARPLIGDAIGGRITMRDLTLDDAIKAINEHGKNLTTEEKNLVEKLFRNEKLTHKEKMRALKLSRPIKIKLAEQQSEPVFKQMMLGSLKNALDRGVTTIEKLEKQGIDADIIKELKTNKKIKGFQITELNNYRGSDGIPYFSDRQIKAIEKMQLATGEHFNIYHCSDATIASSKFGLSKTEIDAIKPSGYTTAQMNFTMSDGTLGELQIRGKGPFAEYEHIAYDARQGKNTLTKTYDKYVRAVSKLTEKDYEEYNLYLKRCYNYYRNLELGIQGTKPILPKKFNKILSQESMEKLHFLDEAALERQMKTFEPKVETRLDYAA